MILLNTISIEYTNNILINDLSLPMMLYNIDNNQFENYFKRNKKKKLSYSEKFIYDEYF
jgi:hypothetical protein